MSVTIVDLKSAISLVGQGEIVRLVTEVTGVGDLVGGRTPSHTHLMLAAERASDEAFTRLRRLAAGGALVLTATRDRFEQLGIEAAERAAEDWMGETPAEPWPNPSALTRAATRLAAPGAKADVDLFTGLSLHCADWAGVINCPQPCEAAVDISRLAGLTGAAVVAATNGAAQNDLMLRTEIEALPTVGIGQLIDYRRARSLAGLHRCGPKIRLPTRYGRFSLQAYEDALTGQLHLALWMGEPCESTLTRIHSECLTGDLFGSERCDCGCQLQQALARIGQEGEGVLIYLRQEGRGIGLINKLRTYAVQDEGFDTVEANLMLGFPPDLREYKSAARILEDLGVRSVRLLTNNPLKLEGLASQGIRVSECLPLVVEPSAENRVYIETKREKLGHWLG